MIIGIGHDVVHVPRIGRMLERWDQRFIDRLFTADEQAYCRRFRDPSPHFAARFAAKEAFYKALSRGKSLRLWFQDAWVVHEQGAVLRLDVSEVAQEMLDDAGVTRSHLSLSHDGEYASAFVVLESG